MPDAFHKKQSLPHAEYIMTSTFGLFRSGITNILCTRMVAY